MTPATRARIQAVIDSMSYRPNHAARALVTRRTSRIGALVHTPSAYGSHRTLQAVERAAHRAGFSVAAHPHVGAPDELEAGIAYLHEVGVDALCVIGPPAEAPTLLRQAATRLPLVVIGGEGSDDLVRIDVDQAAGAAAAVDHLLSLGHRSLLHLAGPLDSAVGAARKSAALCAVERAGARMETTVGDWSSDSGYRVGQDANLLGDATAVFASNDQMALGLIHALREAGRDVPRHVSVVGFDDMPGAAHLLPPLTTVRQDFDALGDRVVAAILRALRGEEIASELLAPELVVRSSTGKVDR